MKKIFLFLCITIHLFNFDLFGTVKSCQYHETEITSIRWSAFESLVAAQKLTQEPFHSIIYSRETLYQDLLRHTRTYSQMSEILQDQLSYTNRKGYLLASSRLYQGLNEVGDRFLKMYDFCIKNHKNYRSMFERGKIHFDRGNVEQCLNDITDLINDDAANEILKEIAPKDFLITKAQAFQELGQYEKAIEALSDVIKEDPENKEAYFHRAFAYFETGNFDRALKDYLYSDKGKDVKDAKLVKSTFKASQEFTTSLLKSVCIGAAEAAVDFVPSLCSTAYGLGSTLWAVHPLNSDSLENTKLFANACYEMCDSIVDYCKSADMETLEECVEEIKTLYENFEQLTDADKGALIGHVVGKHGVDLFAGGGIVKGVSAFRKLKTANKMCTLEAMAVSNTHQEKILASALQHASERKAYLKKIKIEVDKQNKHIVGKHNFQNNKGIFDHPDPQGLLSKFAGKGKPIEKKLGEPGYKERVDFGEHIGYYVHEEDPSIKLPTTMGIIHYSKRGAHIVPSHPKGK